MVMLVFAGLLGQLNRLSAKEARLRSRIGATSQLAGSPSVTHPSRPLHYKRLALGRRHFAPVRFQHLRAKTAKLCSVVAVNLFELRSILRATSHLAAPSAGHRTTGARAPPFA
ncbi:MAG TPA: hypothetical protein VH988_21060 [Thermoanaerobaculia bacterium]|jgi:hypothetical protein|nr:hypothetical protein [Thermoanaerobaculia bacterium]